MAKKGSADMADQQTRRVVAHGPCSSVGADGGHDVQQHAGAKNWLDLLGRRRRSRARRARTSSANQARETAATSGIEAAAACWWIWVSSSRAVGEQLAVGVAHRLRGDPRRPRAPCAAARDERLVDALVGALDRPRGRGRSWSGRGGRGRPARCRPPWRSPMVGVPRKPRSAKAAIAGLEHRPRAAPRRSRGCAWWGRRRGSCRCEYALTHTWCQAIIAAPRN